LANPDLQFPFKSLDFLHLKTTLQASETSFKCSGFFPYSAVFLLSAIVFQIEDLRLSNPKGSVKQ